MLGSLGMEAGKLVKGDRVCRVLAAVDFSTATTMVASFEEGEALFTGLVVARESCGVGL
jgi:hypothetical protein